MERPSNLLAGLALLGAISAAFVLWEIFAPGDEPPVQLPGCDIVFLHEAYKLDAGVRYRDYDLICIVRGSAPPPPCDYVMAGYIQAKGPLPKDVDVRVRRDDSRTSDICRTHYRRDGTR